MPLGNLHTSRVGCCVAGSGRGVEERGNTKNEEDEKMRNFIRRHDLQYSRRQIF
jgi:hypothetical protein